MNESIISVIGSAVITAIVGAFINFLINKDTKTSLIVALLCFLSFGAGIVIQWDNPSKLLVVPDLTDKYEAQAKKIIEGEEMKCEVEYRNDEIVRRGKVIFHEPSRGTYVMAMEPAVVTIFVSRGPKPNVPNVIGLSKGEAVQMINRESLTPVIEIRNSSNSPKGKVISQNPSAGTSVEENTVVNITVSAG